MFLVGGPKCGTTSMAQYLGEHPDIFVADGEPRFFGTDVPGQYNRLTESEYLALFSGATGTTIVGEKSASYLYSTRAASEIARFDPNGRILIMVRNPIDMVYSLHGQLVHKSFREDIVDFEGALDAEPARRAGKRLPKRCWHPGILYYSQIARYTEQIQRYYACFGRQQVHVVVFDDFKGDTPSTYRATLRFLGVDDDIAPDFKVYNPAVRSRSRVVERIIGSRSSFARAAAAITPTMLRPTLGTLHNMLLRHNSIRGKMPSMSEQVRDRLRTIYREEVHALSELLQRDLTFWLK